MTNKPIALITGASSGIGEALAREFSRRGFGLALLARRMDRLEGLKDEFTLLHTPTVIAECDVNDENSLKQAVALVKKEFGHIDLVVANAGFGVVGKMENMSVADYERQFETNVMGVLRTVYATLDSLKASRGKLGLIGSVNGFIGLPGSSPYAMSKFAVRALAEALYYELREYGISVTHIAPGFIRSEIRQVDNQGVYHSAHQDWVPRLIVVPTPRAAREIARAVIARKKQKVITGHGKILVFLVTYFPWLARITIQLFGIKARSEPKVVTSS